MKEGKNQGDARPEHLDGAARGTPKNELRRKKKLLRSLPANRVLCGRGAQVVGFKLLGELFLCLRLLIAIEETNLVNGVRKTVSSFLTSVIDLDQKIKKDSATAGRSIFSRAAVFALRAIMTVMSPIVWALRFSDVMIVGHFATKLKL